MPAVRGFGTYSENFQGCDFSADEWEFVAAVAAYQKRWGRRYPSWREAFHILRSLGYRRVAAATPPPRPTDAEREVAAVARRAAAGTPPPDDDPASP